MVWGIKLAQAYSLYTSHFSIIDNFFCKSETADIKMSQSDISVLEAAVLTVSEIPIQAFWSGARQGMRSLMDCTILQEEGTYRSALYWWQIDWASNQLLFWSNSLQQNPLMYSQLSLESHSSKESTTTEPKQATYTVDSLLYEST